MNGLLPIIRRKRRPLIEVDDRPVVVGHVAAAQVAGKFAEEIVPVPIAQIGS